MVIRHNIRPEYEAAMREIEDFYRLFDQLEPYIDRIQIQAGSDFNLDNRVVLDDQIARHPIEVLRCAADHFSALRFLSGSQDGGGFGHWHLVAPWALMRGALEQASVAVWMANPSDRHTRIERYLRYERYSLTQRLMAEKHFYRQKDRDRYYRDCVASIDAHLPTVFADWFDDPKEAARIRTGINFIECVEMAARAAGVTLEDNATKLWRLASGFAHGMEWARVVAGRYEFDPNDELFPAGEMRLSQKTLSWIVGLVLGTLAHGTMLMMKRSGHDVPDELPGQGVRLVVDLPYLPWPPKA